MHKLLFFLLLFLCISKANSQPLPDSTKAQYAAAKNDYEKGQCLVAYFKQQPLNDATTKANALQLKSWFEKQKDATGINYINLRLAMVLENNGDFPGALNLAFSVLPQFEERKDSFGILTTYGFISATYMAAKDYLNAAVYSKKEISIVQASNDKNLLSRAYNGIACVYGEGNMPDSGMVYAQKSVNIASELKNYKQLALSTSTLGENYIAAGEYDIALPFLRRAASFYKENGASSPYLDAYLKNDFAQLFLATKHYDSSNYYARQALMVSIPYDVKDESRRSYEYLYKSFEQTNQQDSLNKYFRLSMLIKDSLLSLEKVKNIEALTFHEQLRQQEAASQQLKAEEDREQNIQYALIALGIIIFITAFLVFSRTHVANEKLISFFAILGLLIVFEFTNLLIHPWLASFTHESPVLMLLALVLIASLLIPLHHRLEHWIKEKMVEKNKAIRLAAAKKTIAQLGGDKKPRNLIMKKIICLLLFLYGATAYAQNINLQQIDSLKNLLTQKQTPANQIDILSSIGSDYGYNGETDSVRSVSKQMLEIATNPKNDSLLAQTYVNIAYYFYLTSDYKQALENDFKSLAFAESSGSGYNIWFAYKEIGALYKEIKNYPEALKYLKKSEPFLAAINMRDPTNSSRTYSHIAETYLGLGKIDSALRYVQLTNEFTSRQNDPYGYARMLYIFASVYKASGDTDLAESYYKKCIAFSDEQDINLPYVTASTDYGKFLYDNKEYNLALQYALAAYDKSIEVKNKSGVIEAASLLRKAYYAIGQKDSSYYFANVKDAYTDSVFNEQQNNQIQNITFAQQIKEKEDQVKSSDEAQQRNENIQFALIAFGIITFIVFFLLLTRSIIANERLISFFGVLGLLIVFEFINLLLHPWLASFTHESPVLMLLALVLIASLLIPLHHKLEHWIKEKMIEKNKAIRLAAAKKTIEQLGADKSSIN